MSSKEHAPKVYVVDDDPAVLRLLQSAVDVIGIEAEAFNSAREFLAAYQPRPCECLVSDIRMPDIDGIELQKRLKQFPIAPPVIFITGFAEVGIAVEAMKQGAFDFLEKPFSVQALLSKIQLALDRSRTNYASLREQQARDARLALLTDRERGVLGKVIDGKSSREIADLLGISVRTVENHRTRLMEKLHVDSTVELVKLFL